MEAGYYDQSHLTRDFAALAGITPATFAADATAPEVSFVQDLDDLAAP
jgi:AraC-like DNA-binding protein